jgi:LmbE family N-acetylglucosaminyl deacetylase
VKNPRCIVLLQGLALFAAACASAPQPAALPAAAEAATSPAAAPAEPPAEPRLQAAPTTATQSATCFDPATAPVPSAPGDVECANAALLAYDGLLVIGPHPDDESLGFAGLESAYRAAGKPVQVVVTTDGDAYCEACRLWKTSSMTGTTCDALDLSNLATPAVDSFGEVRRGESRAAARALGLGEPTFLGYPDTGLAAAWSNQQAGKLDEPLRRSDFSRCTSCETCTGGYGEGPATELTARSLTKTLTERLAGATDRTLVATTHWLDGHADHAALGNFVRQLNAQLATPHAVAYAVIHGHTPKGTAHPDCWYPSPGAAACPCLNEERCATANVDWVASLSRYRFHPDWAWSPPDDADYGAWKQLCLAENVYHGEGATKLAAVRSYASQLGTLARNGNHPPGLAGIMDCNGYLTSFVRKTEPFVLVDGADAAAAAAPSGGR